MKVYVRKINSSNRKSNYKDNWRVITEHNANGKIARKQIKTFKTKEQAEIFARDHEKSIRIGREYDFDMSLQEFVDNHIRDWALGHYKTKTGAKNVMRMLEKFVLPRVGQKQLDKITITDWESIWQDMNTSKRIFDKYNQNKDIASPDEPYSSQYILAVYMTMCRIYKEAERLEKSISPTIWHSELPKNKSQVTKRGKDILTKDQYTHLLDHLKKNNDRDYWFFRLMLSTGLRLGEALALTNKDIEFVERDGEKSIVIHVNFTINHRETDANGFYKRQTPKTKTSRRKIFLPPQRTAEFMEYLQLIDNEIDTTYEQGGLFKVGIHKRKDKWQKFYKEYFSVRLMNLENNKLKTIKTFDLKEDAENFIYEQYGIKYELYSGKKNMKNIINIKHKYIKPLCECSPKADNCYSCKRIFIKEDGSQIGEGYFSRKLKRLCKELLLPEITVHGLRHTHATMLIQSDQIPIKSITDRLGHASTSTTEDIYIHTTDDYERDKAKVIDELF
tara:strand:+ start:1 stop:1509 length:1509 start_codon:yes stop_codon:yes gene_type:complete